MYVMKNMVRFDKKKKKKKKKMQELIESSQIQQFFKNQGQITLEIMTLWL